jgi:hypothetical protein
MGCSALRAVVVFGLSVCAAVAAMGQSAVPPPTFGPFVPGAGGFQWTTVGAPGNAAWNGTPFVPDGASQRIQGRGSVAYAFNISRTELTIGQWSEFLNTMFRGPRAAANIAVFDEIEGRAPLSRAGATPLGIIFDDGPIRPTSAVAAVSPMYELGWRQAALYCNWLHNNRTNDANLIRTGAYNSNTWGQEGAPTPTITDEAARMPGARFWIPSLDEWMKASFYDPNRYGANQGGWWTNGMSGDFVPVYGPPGVGQYGAPDLVNWPVGQYPGSQSPWGLLDVVGGVQEWTEERNSSSRFFATGWLGSVVNPGIGYFDGVGVRVASIVPTPTTMSVVGAFMVWGTLRRRVS